MFTATQLEKFKDPLWRLNNLYSIITKRDGIQPFRPFPYQNQLFEDIYLKGRRKHVVIKARRMGFSTAIDIAITDLSLFNRALQSSIVDLTQEDAREKTRSKVQVAWEDFRDKGLADLFGIKAEYKGDGHRSWSTGSHIYAGVNARGGTNHFLHISEWGPIAHQDPARSKKILTGALPSADEGIVVVETTWMGGKTGELWQIVKDAQDIPAAEKTEQDFWLTFVPWYQDPRHTLEGVREIEEDILEYLDDMEARLSVKFTPGQKLWYAVNKNRYKDDMGQEYPSTLDEALERRVAGAIYGQWISRARAEGRICDFPIDKRSPVYVFADIGIADYLPLFFVQFVGKEIRLVDWYENNGESISHYAAIIRGFRDRHEVPIASVTLPHDGNRRELSTGAPIKDTLQSLLPNIPVDYTDRPRNLEAVWQGIDWIRDNFDRVWVHKTNVGTQRSKDGLDYPSGLECLENYHQKTAEAGTNTAKVPVHDAYSHTCDALRTMAHAIMQGKLQKDAHPSQLNLGADPGVRLY